MKNKAKEGLPIILLLSVILGEIVLSNPGINAIFFDVVSCSVLLTVHYKYLPASFISKVQKMEKQPETIILELESLCVAFQRFQLS